MLEDTKILAPINGVVGNSSLQVGKFVKAGSGILAIVVQRMSVKIQLDIPAKFKGRVVPSLSAAVTIHTDSSVNPRNTGA